jgi:hypothetical protein
VTTAPGPESTHPEGGVHDTQESRA